MPGSSRGRVLGLLALVALVVAGVLLARRLRHAPEPPPSTPTPTIPPLGQQPTIPPLGQPPIPPIPPLGQQPTAPQPADGAATTFEHQQGTYATPELVVEGGEPTSSPPETLSCPQTLVIYSSSALNVADGQGYGGPGDNDNAVLRDAEAAGLAVAAAIGCPEDCTKRVTEAWRGWRCAADPTTGVLTATAAVELVVVCQVEL